MSPWKPLYWRELRRILTDPRLIAMLLGGPIMYVMVFGGVYWNGRTKHIPLVIVDQDHSRLSRDLTRAVLSSENCNLAFYADSPEEIHSAVTSGRAFAGIVIPRGFESDTLAGRQGKLTMILDGSNILIGNVVSRSIRTIVGSYQTNARTLRLMTSGLPRSGALANALPLQVAVRPLFNPTNNYTFFMLIGLACIALQQVTRMGTAIALGLDSGPDQRRQIASYTRDPLTILSAKFAATATIVLPVAYLVIQLPSRLFGVPWRGSWPLVYALLTVFVLMQILIGYGVAGVFRSPTLSGQVLMFLSVPLFTITGFTWPVYAMPAPVRIVSWLLPITHVTDMFRKIALTGAGIGLLVPQIVPLLLWIPITIAWGYWGVKREIVPADPTEGAFSEQGR